MPILFTQSGDIGFMAEQGAGANLDYGLDWSLFLEASGGDTIDSSVWTPNHPQLVAGNASVSGSVTSVFLSGGAPGNWYSIDNTITTAGGRRETQTCYLFVRDSSIATQSVLFPDRLAALAAMRRDYLPALMSGYGKLSFTDQFIWARLQAAESHIAHTLRVPLRPTTFFPRNPSAEQIAALAGEPWAIDPGYELDPHDVQFGGVRTLKLRQVPVIEVASVEMVYPGQALPVFSMPPGWLKLDAKYGQLQIVPIGSQFGIAIPSAGLVLATMSGGAVMPQVFHVTYRAGIQNIVAAYPDLMDVALRLAALGALKARAMPQSGSISADGLSQSYSAPDFGALHDQIDDELADIRASIVGVRFGVL